MCAALNIVAVDSFKFEVYWNGLRSPSERFNVYGYDSVLSSLISNDCITILTCVYLYREILEYHSIIASKYQR
jgi:putative component of membrane protein insertase Oxa1/YidC/SpoIIIJ protein YidD